MGTINKSLAGEEDLLLGSGSVMQTRNSQDVEINKLRIIKPVSSVSELNALDTDKYLEAAIFNATTNSLAFKQYRDAAWQDMLAESTSSLGSYPVANMQDLGAVGDGVVVDNAAFIAAQATGLPIYFPDGKYLFTQEFALADGTTIFGDSTQTEIILSGEDTKFSLGSSVHDVIFKDITILGTNNAFTAMETLLGPNNESLIFYNVRISGFAIGLDLRNVIFSTFYRLQTDDCATSLSLQNCTGLMFILGDLKCTGWYCITGGAYAGDFVAIGTNMSGSRSALRLESGAASQVMVFDGCRLVSDSSSGNGCISLEADVSVICTGCVFTAGAAAIGIYGNEGNVHLNGCRVVLFSSAKVVISNGGVNHRFVMLGGTATADAGTAELAHLFGDRHVRFIGVHIDLKSSNPAIYTSGTIEETGLFDCTGIAANDTLVDFQFGVVASGERVIATAAINGLTGAIDTGFGLTCVRTAAGSYDFTFDQALATSTPLILLGGEGVVTARSTTGFTVNSGSDADVSCAVYA